MSQMTCSTEPIVTNRIHPHFQRETFLRDFDVYLIQLATENASDGESASILRKKMTILDYPLVSFHALSVAYTNKKECLVLFRKGQVKEGDFVSLLEVFDDNYSVKRIERSDFQNPKFQKEHLFFQDRMLVQLLFNALPRLLDDSEHPIYSNTSGKLYYPFKSTSAKSKSFLEIHLLPNMVLELPLRTFRKYELQTEKDAKKKGKQRKPRHLVIIDPQGHIFPYTSDAKSKQILAQSFFLWDEPSHAHQ